MNQPIKIYRQGAGKPISLLHGWGMNANVFKPLSQSLAADFEVSRVDLPGYGSSDWLPQMDFDAQVDAFAELLPPSTLLGWSMGGLYAMQLVHRYPHKFRQLILVSCNPCFVQREDWSCAMDPAIFTGFSDSLMNDWRAMIRRFLALQMQGAERTQSLIRQVSELLSQGGEPQPEALRFGLQLLLKQDAREVLKKLPASILVVLGGKDKLVPANLAKQLDKINPQIRVECLAHSAHAPFLSESKAFTDLIDEFVKSPATGQGSG